MHRFFAQKQNADIALIKDEEYQHMRKVLRIDVGETVEILLEDGLYLAKILSLDSDGASAAIEKMLPSREANTKITLYQCLPKLDRMESVLQKGVELGVVKFVPVISSRCVAKVDEKDTQKKMDRWQKIVCEAVKQSGRTAVPNVGKPLFWKEAILQNHKIKVVPWEEAKEGSLAEVKNHLPCDDLALYIGPEGGIDNEEIALAAKQKCIIVTLGPRIMRTDTAAIAAVSAIMFASGDMGGSFA